MGRTLILGYVALILCFTSCRSTFIVSDDPLEKIETGYGPEDLAFDSIGNILYIACDPRRTGDQGSIWGLDLTTNESKQIPFLSKLNFEFHPLGLDVFYEDGETYLLVTNIGEKREIDRFVVKDEGLALDHRFVNIIGKPNDVAALSKDEFYYTDARVFGSIIHYDGRAHKILKGLGLANGIFIEGDDLYFTTTIFGNLYRTTLAQPKKHKISNIKGADNITRYDKNQLLITSHHFTWRFMKHSIRANYSSPSLVYKVDKDTGMKEVYYFDNGSEISAVSTALKVGKRIFMGQIYGNVIGQFHK